VSVLFSVAGVPRMASLQENETLNGLNSACTETEGKTGQKEKIIPRLPWPYRRQSGKASHLCLLGR
jgi:hypothetical protein